MKRLRSFKVVAGGVLMLAILVAAEVSQAVAEGFLVADENRMTALVNEHRAAAHAAPSMWQDPALQMVARRQAQRMSAAGFIYHNPNLGAEAGGAVPNWVRVGENVGVGPSVDTVEEAFLASPAHHANIDKSYNLVGLGAVASSNGSLYFTQTFAENNGVAPPLSPPPPPPPPSPAAAAPAGQGQPAPAGRTRCSRRRRRTICRQSRSRRARRAQRGRSSRVRGIELVQPTPDAGGGNQSRVTFTRTVIGTLGKAADKVTFWN